MSEDEKDAQLGRAYRSFQDAKSELGHLNEKVRKIVSAYKDAGAVYEGDLQSVGGRVTNSKMPVAWAGELMNGSELAVLLTERQDAKDRLADAESLLKSFGVTP